jgi:hypothetical protein
LSSYLNLPVQFIFSPGFLVNFQRDISLSSGGNNYSVLNNWVVIPYVRDASNRSSSHLPGCGEGHGWYVGLFLHAFLCVSKHLMISPPYFSNWCSICEAKSYFTRFFHVSQNIFSLPDFFYRLNLFLVYSPRMWISGRPKILHKIKSLSSGSCICRLVVFISLQNMSSHSTVSLSVTKLSTTDNMS